MSEAREPLRRVVVAGDGQVGLLAAIAIRRALPRCEVLILPVPADSAAFSNLAATSLPFTVELHERSNESCLDCLGSCYTCNCPRKQSIRCLSCVAIVVLHYLQSLQ